MSDKPALTHYVSLDLGSETMAAYCEAMRKGEGGLIPLQDRDLIKKLIEVKLGSTVTKEVVELFRDEGGDLFRLRTRIALEESKQPRTLELSHAKLDFLGNGHQSYKDSLFRYFHTSGQALLTRLLPNPKIVTQYSALPILPKIKTRDGDSVQYPPKELLKHLITQVVRNFIKHGLKNLDSLKIVHPPQDMLNVHLVLTVPNIYSDRLVKELKTFLDAHAGVGRVSIVYESDAIAYYLRRHECKGKYSLYGIFSDPVLSEDLRLLTFDMGRGTTDLSLIQLVQPTDNSPSLLDRVLRRIFGRPTGAVENEAGAEKFEHHTMLARTGKSDGGNKLTYIFAEYFNRRLQKLFEGRKAPLFWDFLSAAGESDLTTDNAEALAILETLIEAIKKSFTGSYSVKLTPEEQKPYLRKILERATRHVSDFNVSEQDLSFMSLTSLRWIPSLLAEKSSLPKKVARRAVVGPRAKVMGPRARIDDLAQLKYAIEKYVAENVEELIDELVTMAERMENSPGNVVASSNTFVVVAGRASHFAPVRKAIEKSCRTRGLQQHVEFLKDDDAKYACCMGAITYVEFQSRHQALNRDEMFGTYGFLSAASSIEMFKAVDMNVARTEPGGAEVLFNGNRPYSFIWTKRPVKDGDPIHKLPSLADGRTVRLGQFEGQRFRVRYVNNEIYVSVFGQDAWGAEEKVGEPMSFADINEAVPIYEKLWPEALRPRSER